MASFFVDSKSENSVSESKEDKKVVFNVFKKGGLKSLIIILILLVVAVILFNYSSDEVQVVSGDAKSVNFTTSLNYINQLEDKLNKVISNIKGAGTINVMISIDSSPELSIAETTEGKTTTTSTGSVTTTTTEPIIVKVNGEESPLVLKETLPEIKGVIVVSSGASDVKIKLDIITAVTTALGIDSNKVEVFVGIWGE